MWKDIVFMTSDYGPVKATDVIANAGGITDADYLNLMIPVVFFGGGSSSVSRPERSR